MPYTAAQIAQLIAPYAELPQPALVVRQLLTDSRHLVQADETLFFALPGPRRSGDSFIADLYELGVRNFVVQDAAIAASLQDANVLIVPDALAALQQLAAHHRQQFSFPVIGITGSNGKTIVKEWLYQLLQENFAIVRSPRSYNSQVGVPLSVWQMSEQHTLGLFEAGISQRGEMQRLAAIIQPTIGVFTNLGEAHSAGFSSNADKAAEKSLLFREADVVICQEKYAPLFAGKNLLVWGSSADSQLQVSGIKKESTTSVLHLQAAGQTLEITIPFTDEASVENAITCCAVLMYLQKNLELYKDRFATLQAVDMRLHLFEGINGCNIINDSYSADLTSLSIALNFLKQQQTGQPRTVILSDFVESKKADERLYQDIAKALRRSGVHKLVGIGEHISEQLPQLLDEQITPSFYPTTEEALRHFRTSQFSNELVLIKGARRFGFERIARLFEQKVHQTVLQINLNAMVHNLKQHQRLLQRGTRLMAMVKAFSYGSGGAEIASVLQANSVDYLGVAYTDEGVELRREGISLPIMVINADASSFDALVDYNLQPVIYSEDLLQRFGQYIAAQGLSMWPVHLEVETGMNRLGFAVGQMTAVAEKIAAEGLLKIESVFSHLAASEDPAQDAYTLQQAHLLQEAVDILQQHIAYPFIRHIANSAAILRHPQLQLDMVRLGIGLYGVETAATALELQPVATLRSTIAQLKTLQPGETVSYNRRGVIDHPTTIATVRIGYADGYARHLGNGVGKMWVQGRLAPVVGTVCMDMTMIDVTGIGGVQEGDEVIVFGPALPVQQVAAWASTIPYEVMTSISQRVKRVYFQE
ncbi:bifunctional UDP-N-acetylmuramoyl-tripeptide:D-alanyl-D-alanine ligase/alanine racemase [Paracnuella aquatica]|uniref:bifunctional UDP-N-acetylmuramoyl-tripeptide:D-alanyl-D-alanine ligase/alanine racemase n=1 Tax=Paracnuella aquatica TaxID=2268757 RepID=UPI000DEFD5F6|nr:bifunctional UDP-N-acetylmuramoyl-tripeptide:D-alanyl-D-alanine ligase/alanine racemase [Paracnuella aquatica]RPD43704.1 bifunctional UDP-N-acetylmuramoyl-tripeptide:D-alanyl-D-alanine ligase/alanine racemase [Paracnuella aquatica]